MTKAPLYSIIIPTYNRAEKLARAVRSVAQQEYGNYEVIVCDDGSTDHTKQIIDDFVDKINIKYIWQENWGGPARPRNNGIQVAAGEWICFLDSDDWWYPKKLKVVKDFLHESDLIYHDLDIYTQKGKKIFKKLRARRLKKPVFVDLMTSRTVLFNSSVVVKKSIINKVGKLKEDLSLVGVEDSDFWLRIARVTDKFVYIPESLGAYWAGGGNVTEISERQIGRISALYSKHMPFLSDADRMQAEMLISYAFGRIKQQLGCGDEAVQLFKKSLHSRNLVIKLKSIYCLIMSHVSYGGSNEGGT